MALSHLATGNQTMATKKPSCLAIAFVRRDVGSWGLTGSHLLLPRFFAVRPEANIEAQVSRRAPGRHIYFSGNRSATVARTCQAGVPVGRIAL